MGILQNGNNQRETQNHLFFAYVMLQGADFNLDTGFPTSTMAVCKINP